MIKLSFVDYVQFILNKPYIFVIKYLCLNQKKKKNCVFQYTILKNLKSIHTLAGLCRSKRLASKQ